MCGRFYCDELRLTKHVGELAVAAVLNNHCEAAARAFVRNTEALGCEVADYSRRALICIGRSGDVNDPGGRQ